MKVLFARAAKAGVHRLRLAAGFAAAISLSLGSGALPSAEEAARSTPSNVLLVIIDDVGLDAVGCYGAGNNDLVRTPHLDQLAKEGVRFETVWAYPSCSPTRATILTGQYGFRTGVGSVVRIKEGDLGLALTETSLAEAIKTARPGTTAAFFGKWHLAGAKHGVDHAREQGFDEFHGTMGNIGGKLNPLRYFAYDQVHNGKESRREAYATTATTDDAAGFIASMGENPWCVVASYHAAHTPIHAPPRELRTIELEGVPKDSPPQHFAAMIEALDAEIGRLVESLDPKVRERTHIIVVGDNGGASHTRENRSDVQGPGKGSLAESGLRVPLIVAGPNVKEPGRVSHKLVSTTDLFDSVVDLCAGTPPAKTPDSVSIVPYLRDPATPSQREWLFAERFRRANSAKNVQQSDRFAIRGERFKLIEDRTRKHMRFFDLTATAGGEGKNLLAEESMPEDAKAALARLQEVMVGPFGTSRLEALPDFK